MLRSGTTEAVRLLDFFPHTPLTARRDGQAHVEEILADFGTATQAFHIGAGTTATPGFFPGLEALHRAGASIALTDLVAPAAKAARDGVLITDFQHHLATVVRPILTATTDATAVFAPEGEVLRAGHCFTNPGLADALELLAASGFTNSEVADRLLDLQRDGGHLTRSDLDGYEVVARSPLGVRVGDTTVFMNPLPAASGILIAHSLEAATSDDPVAMALAFDATDRARRAAAGDLAALSPQALRQRGTTHVSVIDPDGNACAVTTSNGSGNGELVAPFGFMPNNILGEEDVNPSSTGEWPAATRLHSGMCPAIMSHDDGAITALGSGGSNRIRTAIGQVVMRLCFSNAALAGAIDAPRVHVERGHLDFEDFFEGEVTQRLVAQFADHRSWPERNLFFGGVHAAQLDADGRMSGAGDGRRDGCAIVVD